MKKNILKKIGAVTLSTLMTVGVASQGISTVEAAQHQLQYYGKSTAYGSTVGNFNIDGRQAWCLEHAKKTPGSSNMNAEVYTSTDAKFANIRKIMYYGWNGYQTWSGMNGLTTDQRNVIMSKALSHAYSGTALSKGKMTDFYNYATSKADPLHQNNLVFSKNQLNTYYDKNAKVQKSESTKLNGPNKYKITINTQNSNVKVVNESKGQSGQSVDVYGGDTVHYEATAGFTGSVKSGTLKGGFTFAPLIAWNGDAKFQHVGTWITIDPGTTTYLNANFKAVNGSLNLKKTDAGGKALDGAVFNVKGAGYDKDITVTKGNVTVNDLPAGDYTIKEKTAPWGYLLNGSTFYATVKANETAQTTITDEAPSGQISIKKSDSQGNIQGEASLEGAEYTVYGIDGKEVGKITTDRDGNGSLSNLWLGKYTVKETKAPEAYELDPNTYTVELTYKDQSTSIILGNVDSKETVKSGYISIFKEDAESHPLKGGEFGIYANADMYIGSTLYKKGQLVQSVKTDENGEAWSNSLPYGSYYVQELNAPSQDDGNKDNFVIADETKYVKITGKNSEVNFVDKKVTATKVDISGSSEVKGAEMTVVDNDGKVMDTWTSDGSAHSIKGLHEGWEYTLIEKTAPKGFVKAESIKFTVSRDKKDESLVMKDKQFTATKKDASGKNAVEGAKLEVRDAQNNVVDSWTSGKEEHYISGLEEGKSYRLVEAEAPEGFMRASDIWFTVSNEKKNESVEMKDKQFTITKTDVTGKKEVEGAKLTVKDESGKVVDSWTSGKEAHHVSGLEETAPNGYVKSEDITFVPGSKETGYELTMKDSQITAKKTDVTGKKEVEGAEMTVTDKDGNVVDSWTSGKEEHYINNLKAGEKYTLSEKTAPNGYVKAENIEFTAGSDYDQNLVMKDSQITAKKTDVTGKKEVEGAEMTVTDEAGNVVDKWTSGKEEHYINNLQAGKKYILSEKTAPKGYVKAENIEFTAGEDKNQNLVMKDSQITAKKTDVAGKEVEGAEMTVTDEAGNVVDEWTSSKEEHYINNLQAGKKYILSEKTAPKGYVKAESVEFTAGGDKNQNLVMKDKRVSITKTDITGKKEVEGAEMTVTDEEGKVVDSWTSGKEAHYVSGLEEGKNYTLSEKTAPKGFVKAEEIKFSVSNEKKDQTFDMNDKQVIISKKDVAGKEVEGAKLTVKDDKGNVVDSWTSGKEDHYVSGLEEGKTYTLTEEVAPKGYVRAETITFTVTDKKDIQKVTMVDTQVKVSKTDAETTEDVKGAEFTVFDKDGNAVDKWTTDGTSHAVDGLEAGKEYTIKETKTPEGYQTASDETFTASGDQDKSIEIKEKPILTNIQVNKVDAQTKKVIKSKEFEFTMYSDADCKNVLAKVSANKDEGTATFKSLRYGTYYIKETKAPEGYLLSKEVKKVVVNDKLENVGKTYSFIYQDTPMPAAGGAVKTGDSTNIRPLEILCGLSGIGFLACVLNIIRKKRKAQ